MLEKWKNNILLFWEWLQTDYGMIFSTIVFLPFGLFLIYKNKKINRNVKIGCMTIGIIYIFIFAGVQAKMHNLSITNENQIKEIKNISETLQDKNEVTKTLEKKVSQFNEYKAKMKPYEALSDEDAKKRKIDADAADKVNKALNEIPELALLSVNDKSKLSDVRKLYDSLSDSQKNNLCD